MSASSFIRIPTSDRLPLTIACGLMLMLVAGCRDTAPQPTAPTSTAGGDGTTVTDRQCDRLLNDVIAGSMPDRLGISSERKTIIDDLQTWWLTCGADNSDVAVTSDEELRIKLLGEDVAAATMGETYSKNDITYIRDSLLDQISVHHATAEAQTDTERAVDLFAYLTRTMPLVPLGVTIPELSPYESQLFGVCTPADRALIFAGQLRQLRLDAVVLQPREAKSDATDEPPPDATDDDTTPDASPMWDETSRWLIGVIVDDGRILLFDPFMGLPLPAKPPKGEPLDFTKPATLKDVRADDSLLRQLDLGDDHQYPLTAGQLESCEVKLIGNTSLWSPRMAEIQFALVREDPVRLYDGLGENELYTPGLYKRVEQAGDGLWKTADIGIWQYPLELRERLDHRSQEDLNFIQQRGQILTTPLDVKIATDANNQPILNPDGSPQFTIVPPEQNMRKARTDQLMGNFQAARRVYVSVRLAPKQLKENVLAAPDADYWTGVSQYEEANYDGAARTLSKYHAKNPQGFWAAASLRLLGQALAQLDEFTLASEVSDVPNPVRSDLYGLKLLSNRWKALAGETSTDNQSKKNETKTEDEKNEPSDEEVKKTETPDDQATDDKETDDAAKPKPDDAKPNDDQTDDAQSDAD